MSNINPPTFTPQPLQVKVSREGSEVTLRPKHLVLATGLQLG